MGACMKLRFFIFCVLAALAGCHRDSSTASAVRSPAHLKAPVAPPPGPTAQAQTAAMVEAATQGKSQVPVSLKFDLLQRPVQGQPLDIAIALLPQIPAGPATIEVTASDGLQLGAGENQIEFAEVEAEQVYRHNVKLTPTAEGVFLLTLNVSLKHDQVTDSRVFSVPIIVVSSAEALAQPPGSPAAPPPPSAATQHPKGASP
jgi:hypothetical protein